MEQNLNYKKRVIRFFDGDEIPIYDKENLQEYKFRGLYQTSKGKLINADCN